MLATPVVFRGETPQFEATLQVNTFRLPSGQGLQANAFRPETVNGSRSLEVAAPWPHPSAVATAVAAAAPEEPSRSSGGTSWPKVRV